MGVEVGERGDGEAGRDGVPDGAVVSAEKLHHEGRPFGLFIPGTSCFPPGNCCELLVVLKNTQVVGKDQAALFLFNSDNLSI